MNNYIIKLLIVALPFMMIGCSISQSKKNSDYRVVVTDESTVAQTIYGAIQGYRDGDVFTFKGIPYAQAERFMPPTAPEKHNDTLKCRLYGPKAPQMESLEWKGINQTDYAFGNQFVYEPMDEKGCLVLNVWTKGLNDGKKRPVFVWIHGGGYFAGSGHDLPCYEGWALAEKGDIVTLTLNHRLNILGYSDLTALGGKYENSVNLGMQDIVMALKWVHDNITNFGGDPNNVTIGGQSGAVIINDIPRESTMPLIHQYQIVLLKAVDRDRFDLALFLKLVHVDHEDVFPLHGESAILVEHGSGDRGQLQFLQMLFAQTLVRR